jgi:hypothetical protein
MDLSIFNEVSESLKILNEQHRTLHTVIKDMISEYHMYHILSEKCEKIANATPQLYFENIYKELSKLNNGDFKE